MALIIDDSVETMKHKGLARRAALKLIFLALLGAAVLGVIARVVNVVPMVVIGIVGAIWFLFVLFTLYFFPRSHRENARCARPGRFARARESGCRGPDR